MASSSDRESDTQDLSFLWLEITAKCNLECLHCYADSSPRQDLLGRVATDTWLTVLAEAATLGCTQVQFIGGEPTLHPDLAPMVRTASACGYSLIEVFTNATLFDEQLADTFVEHGVAIATSFYSDDATTHDRITKHRGSFAHTVSNLKRFVSLGLQVRAGIIEMPENAGHAKRAKVFLEGLGISDINIDLQRGVGRGGKQLHSLDPFAELCGQCWKGKLCITSLGRVYPCVFSRFADLGDVRKGIATILQEAPLSKFRATLSQKQNNHASNREHSNPNQALTITSPERYVCSPDLCAPKSSEKCLPSLSCSPDGQRCNPATGPCSPETRCPPTTRRVSAAGS